jgi:large subunit ribosomal protein L21e
MPQSHGSRRKTRSLVTKGNTVKGLSYLLIDYKVGDTVVVNVDPREHNSMPHRRFQGKVGIVQDVGRRSLKIAVKLGEKEKILQTRLNHIKPFVTRKAKLE